MIAEEKLIFLICAPRSGSTILSHTLGKVDAIQAGGEPWLMLAIEQFGRINPRHEYGAWHVARGVDSFLGGEINTVRSKMARVAYSELLAPGKSYFLDKTPGYFWIVEFLQRTFPRAKFIALTRNPLAIAASFKSAWGLNLAPDVLYDNADIALFQLFYAIEQVQCFAENQRARDERTVVDYDEFIYRPGPVIERLLAVIGVAASAEQIAADPINTRDLSQFNFGDRKILSTKTVHEGSRDAWRGILTDQEAALVANYFNLEGPGMAAIRSVDGAVTQAEALRSWLAERLAERRRDYRSSYDYGAYAPGFNERMHQLMTELR